MVAGIAVNTLSAGLHYQHKREAARLQEHSPCQDRHLPFKIIEKNMSARKCLPYFGKKRILLCIGVFHHKADILLQLLEALPSLKHLIQNVLRWLFSLLKPDKQLSPAV